MRKLWHGRPEEVYHHVDNVVAEYIRKFAGKTIKQPDFIVSAEA